MHLSRHNQSRQHCLVVLRRWGVLALAVSLLGLGGAWSNAAEAPAFHPHRILVMPRDESRLPALQQFHAARQRRIERAFPQQGNLQIVRLAEGEQVAEAVARYRASGLVGFAEPDYVVSAAATLPNDPRFQDGTQWGLNNYGQNGGLPDADVDAPEAWDVYRAASNVVVAIVDSGIRYTHEDLAGNLWTNQTDGTHGFNARTGDHDPWDENGHGTHLAGIIGAVTDNARGVAGVAWRVRMMGCKFLDAAGNGFNSDAVACIEFARTNGADVINMSWGGTDFSAAVSNAIWFARADGIVVVAAAGNNAGNIDAIPFYPASLALDNLVTVGASTRLDGVWNLSNYGANSVDLFAPGAAIFSTTATGDAAYGSLNGSSMASAYVAGALALLRAESPAATGTEPIARLLAAVDHAPAFTGKCVTGGRLNLRKVLDRPRVTVTPNVWPIELRINGVTGHGYVLSASTNLVEWTALRTNVAGPDGGWEFADGAATNFTRRFYRAYPRP